VKELYKEMFEELSTQVELNLSVLQESRKIFVNRNLKMKKIKMIGFDMDYTLAAYKKTALEVLQYEKIKTRLINKANYPKEILKYKYIEGFVILGLFLDLENGNLLKVDRYNFVSKGYRGLTELTDEELHKVYRSKNEPIKFYENFARTDTMFSLPETCLFSQIINDFPLGSFYNSYKELYEEIRGATDTLHRDGTLKTDIMANLEKYINKDIDLPLTLHNLKNSGKKIFLLTNSYYEYSNKVMSYLFDDVLEEYESWRDYFDLIIVGSKKPAFFSDGTELIKLGEDGEHLDDNAETKIFQGGNLEHLESFTGLRGENILYVGDHIYGDILKVKKKSLWRTALIVETLEEEIEQNMKNKDFFDILLKYDYKINILDTEMNYQKIVVKSIKKTLESGTKNRSSFEIKILEELVAKTEAKITKLSNMISANTKEYHILKGTLDKKYNKYWGMIFKDGREKTKYAAQLEDFACLYTSRVSNFLFYSPKQYFRSPVDVMAHEIKL